MKKAIIAIVLTFAVLGACSNSNTKDQKIVAGNNVTTTTRWSDPAGDALKAACQSDAVTLGSEWTSLASAIQNAVDSGLSNNSAVIQAIKDAVNSGIVKTRSWISDCGSYFPETTTNLKSVVNGLEVTVGNLG